MPKTPRTDFQSFAPFCSRKASTTLSFLSEYLKLNVVEISLQIILNLNGKIFYFYTRSYTNFLFSLNLYRKNILNLNHDFRILF